MVQLSIAEVLARHSELSAVSDTTQLDTQLLLCDCLNKPQSYLKTWPEKFLSSEQLAAFDQIFQRRKAGEPMAYILGRQGFWTLDLQVNSSTLIPRPETELLVELALEKLPSKPVAILDLGTGTGAIALALASENAQWNILACDKQPEAVALARLNAQQLGFSSVEFIESDWFSNVPIQRFDMIVSNPPYIDPVDPHLNQGDVRFEPQTALIAEDGGLADIKTIVLQAKKYLADGGWLMLEHGYDQGACVADIFQQQAYQNIVTEQDLGARDRVTMGQYFSH